MRAMCDYIVSMVQCAICKEIPVGHYYENSKRKVCQKCYGQLVQSKGEGATKGMIKVRDCSSIHHHDFPGHPPKTIVSLRKTHSLHFHDFLHFFAAQIGEGAKEVRVQRSLHEPLLFLVPAHTHTHTRTLILTPTHAA